jgi:hypothetical protein
MSSQTNVVSFVVRFVQKTTTLASTDPSEGAWHGVVKHVQSNEEQRFSRLADALAFMAKYVNLDALAEMEDSLPAAAADRAEPGDGWTPET